MSTVTRTPRFNHVAMSVPADLLDEHGRADILRFWGGVFGFEELPTETVDRQKLVLSAYDWEQFVFLIAEDQPMSCPRLDHFGMSVGSLEELEAFHAKARAFADEDDRVDLIAQDVEDHGVVRIHNFYVRYLFPMMIEVQYFDWDLELAKLNPGERVTVTP
jgi:hypothetical protein